MITDFSILLLYIGTITIYSTYTIYFLRCNQNNFVFVIRVGI